MEACPIGTVEKTPANCRFVVKVIVLMEHETPPADGSIMGMDTRRPGFAREALIASEMGELVQNFLS